MRYVEALVGELIAQGDRVVDRESMGLAQLHRLGWEDLSEEWQQLCRAPLTVVEGFAS